MLASRFPFRLRRWLVLTVAGVLALAAFVVTTNLWMIDGARNRTVQELSLLPANDVALVLGTSPTLRGNRANPFFEGRMRAAAELYRAGKATHLLLTGDHGRAGYDEPSAMRAALVAQGVPFSAMTLDYAGFRTLDSLARAGQVFGLQRVTVVTDDFHEARALFLARAFGLEAIGYPSPPVPARLSVKARTREVAARAWACLDVYLFRTQPKYPGPPQKIRLVAR